METMEFVGLAVAIAFALLMFSVAQGYIF